MKALLILFSICIIQTAFSQSGDINAAQLLVSFQNIEKAASKKYDENAGDNLQIANKNFRQNLLNFTGNSKNSGFDYKDLKNNYLIITKSDDGNLTLFSWDTETGGSMRVFEVVAQYKVGQKFFSKVIGFNSDQSFDPKCFYYQIDDIQIKAKTYYLTRRKSILSSALTYHGIQAFSIEGTKLNEAVKIIKTKSGLKSTVGYETDLSAAANREKEIPDFDILYSAKDQTISIPLILGNSEITSRKIQYKLNGSYFKKF